MNSLNITLETQDHTNKTQLGNTYNIDKNNIMLYNTRCTLWGYLNAN